MSYSDPAGLVYGRGEWPPPPVVNVPDGWTVVKIRLRAGEIGRVYLRSSNGSFARWGLKFTDATRSAMEPWGPEEANWRENLPSSNRK